MEPSRYKVSMNSAESYLHQFLPGGIELGLLHLPGRQTASYEIRVLSGLAEEPSDKLGLAGVLEETIDKGTSRRDAQAISDAFDMLGAQIGSSTGREAIVFRCTCLPEYLEDAMALHAEMLRDPVFPEESCQVAVQNGLQELAALEDDPGDLARKLLAVHAFGPVLGRHVLGTESTLRSITRDDVVRYWRRLFCAGRLQIVVGGAVEPQRVIHAVERLFDGFGDTMPSGRDGFPLEFAPGLRHHAKELEQEHILVCWPGIALNHPRYPVEHLILAMLSDGMSSRLFVEVREKLGLVYWVGAWDEHPRKHGMIFLGASTTPARCAQTYQTLLKEVDRLGVDVSEEELERAKVGIIAKTQTHGDITRARVAELGGDLFHYGRPVPPEEKNAKIAAVTVADVKDYLVAHPRNPRCVLTLGPRELTDA